MKQVLYISMLPIAVFLVLGAASAHGADLLWDANAATAGQTDGAGNAWASPSWTFVTAAATDLGSVFMFK